MVVRKHFTVVLTIFSPSVCHYVLCGSVSATICLSVLHCPELKIPERIESSHHRDDIKAIKP